MRIKFDYKGATPEDIETVLKHFYETYQDSLGTDGEPIEIGKINIYISINNHTDNKNLFIQDKDGDTISWTVKNRVMQKTNKKAIVTFVDTENDEDKLIIYRDKERQNKKWRY